ncbi:cytochrome P450, partial [Geobacillus sp. MMMUD3]|nr:cytochrome P450 [Geobacillus sp. MMMUD3]
CPARTEHNGQTGRRRTVLPAGLSFSDGAHRCPGQPVALVVADALLHRLLACEPTLLTTPVVGHDSVIAGARLRGLDLGFTVPSRPRRR